MENIDLEGLSTEELMELLEIFKGLQDELNSEKKEGEFCVK